MGCSERRKELKRRRHRKKKLAILKRRWESASAAEREKIAAKVRRLTPGADVVLANWGYNQPAQQA